MFSYFRILKDLCLIFFSKTESEFFYYIVAVVRNLMLNASWNYVSKMHLFKILNKKYHIKTSRTQRFKKCGLLPGHL